MLRPSFDCPPLDCIEVAAYLWDLGIEASNVPFFSSVPLDRQHRKVTVTQYVLAKIVKAMFYNIKVSQDSEPKGWVFL
jgi:hypothetical protein